MTGEHGYYDGMYGETMPNYALLKAVALVCRAWSGPAQTLLFRSAYFRHSSSKKSLKFHAALLSSATRGKVLADHVRTLDLSIGRITHEEVYSPDDFAMLLKACPQLYNLVLMICGIEKLEEETLKKLGDAGRQLKALDLLGSSPIFSQLLKIWPNIQFLKIRYEANALWPRTNGAQVLRRDTDAGDLEWAQQPGAEVCLYDLALPTCPTPDFLTWLLASSADSLRILELRGIAGTTQRDILALHAPRLRSLRLFHYDIHSAALLHMCTALEELVVNLMPTPVPPASDLPPTIEHLSFSYHRNSLQPVIEAVDALPKLRVLTCDSNAKQEVVDYKILKAKCRVKGVEIASHSPSYW
ncbi:hypothetical protein DFH29DRAFT_878052 [Suillus ampliporus]|nr:hypothetical protein DFH29DRAFT_878052 [Suillus ampliporus]